MSLQGSLFFTLQSIVSNGAGASVGLEGGFTEPGSLERSRWSRARGISAPRRRPP
jgi:hypothetical protein